MKKLYTTVLLMLICNSWTNCQEFTGYYMSVYNLPIHKSIFGISIRFPGGGQSFLTRICLTADSTFQYDFGGDLMSDKAKGIIVKNRKLIKLTYLTPTYSIYDLIKQEQIINTNPPTTVSYKIPIKLENPIAHIRPIEIKYRSNRLVVIKTNDSTLESDRKRNKLRKVRYNKWIKYGPIMVD
jgi:hypothetical protein